MWREWRQNRLFERTDREAQWAGLPRTGDAAETDSGPLDMVQGTIAKGKGALAPSGRRTYQRGMGNCHSVHQKLRAIEIFHDFTDAEMEQFIELTDPTEFKAGEIIVRQNEPGTCMFFVAEGACRVVTHRDDSAVELARLGPGDVFGELALFDHRPRSADVEALADCVLLKINEGVLRALAGVFPNAAFKFLLGVVREIGDRLRKTNVRYLDSVLGQH